MGVWDNPLYGETVCVYLFRVPELEGHPFNLCAVGPGRGSL